MAEQLVGIVTQKQNRLPIAEKPACIVLTITGKTKDEKRLPMINVELCDRGALPKGA